MVKHIHLITREWMEFLWFSKLLWARPFKTIYMCVCHWENIMLEAFIKVHIIDDRQYNEETGFWFSAVWTNFYSDNSNGCRAPTKELTSPQSVPTNRCPVVRNLMFAIRVHHTLLRRTNIWGGARAVTGETDSVSWTGACSTSLTVR